MISVDEYQLFKERMEWHEAASSCEQKGGFLPSILSRDESRSIYELVGRTSVWSGASRDERLATGEDPWEWADGSPWSDKDDGGFSNWPTWLDCQDEYHQRYYSYNCSPEPKCMYLYYEWWWPYRCNYHFSYVCQFKPSDAEASYSFKKDDIGNSINIYMDISMDRLKGSHVPGFKVVVHLIQIITCDTGVLEGGGRSRVPK